MTRFFFDFRQAGTLTPDSAGLEFESVEQAYLEAFNGAQEMWGELLRKRQDPRCCAFEVRDAQNQAMFVLPFHEVLEVCTGRQSASTHCTFDQVRKTFNAAQRVREELRIEFFKVRERLKESRALLAIEIGEKVP